MYGMNKLKKKIEINDISVECPVSGCSEYVVRQRRGTARPSCEVHRIHISPTTFSYPKKEDNLLWTDPVDLKLLGNIGKVKRESRMEENNSEDALTWNVFRFIERNDLISSFTKEVIGIDVKEPNLIYWSYSQSNKDTWPLLDKGRNIFELNPAKGSEPDLIIYGKNAVIIVEAKFGAGNTTIPSKPYVEDKYVNGAQCWWRQVFRDNFKTVAIENRKYELSRFWLIGSWIANDIGTDFYLTNLTLEKQSNNIERDFKQHIKEDKNRTFKRITWEQIYNFVSSCNCQISQKEILLDYFRNKTLGYDANGNIRKAFTI